MVVLLVMAAVAIGFMLMRLANPAGEQGPQWAAFLLELALGAGFGIALVSLLFFALLLIHAAYAAVMLSAEAVLLVASSGLLLVRPERKTAAKPEARATGFWWYWMLRGAFMAGVFLVVAAMENSARTIRFGTWDAWNIWNLRAKFLAGPGDTWTRAFSPALNYFSHPDYPLLLSGFVAQAWKFSGGTTSPLVPSLTAAIFAASVVALLISALALVRGMGSALLAGLVLLATSSFLGLSMSQYADVPLSFYYLATIVLALLSADSQGTYRAVIAVLFGAFASFAAWTKNEGLVFFILSMGCYLFVLRNRKTARSAVALWCYPLLGAVPGLLVVGYFKMFLAPPSDLGGQSGFQVLYKLVQPGRYWIIGKALVARALELGDWWTHPLLLIAILAITLGFRINERQRKGVLTGWLLLILLFLAYCGVYLITPLDLRFHLSTSLVRLYSQMWPSFLFLTFLVLARPEDLWRTRGDDRQASSVRASRRLDRLPSHQEASFGIFAPMKRSIRSTNRRER